MKPLLRLLIAAGSVFVRVIPERYGRWWPVPNENELRGPAIASGILATLIGMPGPALYFAVALNG